MSRTAVAVALVALAGCGFQAAGSAPSDATAVDGSDSRVDSDAGSDAGPDPTAGECEHLWQAGQLTFNTPVPIAGLGTGAGMTTYDTDPWLSHDELTIYWVGGSGNSTFNDDLYVATRTSKTGGFSNPQRVVPLATDGDDSKAALTIDELDVIVAAIHPPFTSTNFFEATRATKGDTFSALSDAPFTNINTAAAEFDPHVDPTGLRLYYSAIVGGKQKIVLSERSARGGVFGSPALLPVVNDGMNPTLEPVYAADPALSENEHIILFSTDRTAPELAGNMWYAVRSSRNDNFAEAKEVPMLNANGYDGNAVLSADNCTVYFGSDRSGQGRLYSATLVH